MKKGFYKRKPAKKKKKRKEEEEEEKEEKTCLRRDLNLRNNALGHASER